MRRKNTDPARHFTFAATIFRFILGPLTWRLLLITLVVLLVIRFPTLHPYSDHCSGLSSMYYAVSGVLGILAGFLVASLSVVGLGNTESAERMKKIGPRSLPLKLLYAVVCLFLIALAVAFVGPFADQAWAFGILSGGVLVALSELVMVAVLVFIALNPRPRKEPNQRLDLDR